MQVKRNLQQRIYMLINNDSEDDMDDDIFTHCAFSASNTFDDWYAPSSSVSAVCSPDLSINMGTDYSSDDSSDICAAFNATPAWTEHTDSEELYRDMLNVQSDSHSDSDSELETDDSEEISITGNFRMENMSYEGLSWQESTALHLDININRIPPS